MEVNTVAPKVALALLLIASAFYLIALSSSAWMKYDDTSEHKQLDDYTTRYGLWEQCWCRSVANSFWKDTDYDSSEKKDTPWWYIASDALATLALVAAFLSLISHVFAGCCGDKAACIFRLVVSILAIVLILLSVSIFGDQFRMTQVFEKVKLGTTVIAADWGLGMAILAMLLMIGASISTAIELCADDSVVPHPPTTAGVIANPSCHPTVGESTEMSDVNPPPYHALQ